MKIIEQSARILDPLPEEMAKPLKHIEYAARKCYNSLDRIAPGSDEKIVRSLIRRGHTSPLEFGTIMVEIVTSRDVLAELTRHRLASYCVESQRYVAEKGDIEFIRPNFYSTDLLDAKKWCATKKWEADMAEAENSYHYYLNNCSLPPEDARKCLPSSTATTLVMRANVTEWRHILSLRLDKAAYPEMRTLMKKILKELQRIPCLFDDFTEDGYAQETEKEAG